MRRRYLPLHVSTKKNKPRLTRQPDNIYERVVETSKAGLNRTFTSQKSFGDKLYVLMLVVRIRVSAYALSQIDLLAA